MDQALFEEAVLAALRRVPNERRAQVLRMVRALVSGAARTTPGNGTGSYDVERHRAVRQRTSALRGSLAAAIVGERDERG